MLAIAMNNDNETKEIRRHAHPFESEMFQSIK